MSHTLDLWLGKAASKRSYNAFFKESYGDDSAPISPFAASQGETFYDHDLLETQFNPKFKTLDDVLKRLSYSSSFAEAVREKVAEFDHNFSVACFGDDFEKPRSFQDKGITLIYIGRFEYDQKLAPVGDYDHLGHAYIHILGDHKPDFEGKPTDCIRVDAYGLMIGRTNPYGRSLDISGIIPEVADNQLRISVNEEGIWELREFGNNGLSRLGVDSFDNKRSMPGPGIKFSVGALEFLWSDRPK